MAAGHGRDSVVEFLMNIAKFQPGSMKYRLEIMNMQMTPKTVGRLAMIWLEID
jgi:hypothetical protein